MKFFPIDKNGATPVYIQLAQIIKKNITEGILKEGDLVPSESKFMEKYGVSRLTVRSSLLRLVYDGLLFKVHGRGTFVSSYRPIAITSPFDSLEKHLSEKGIMINHELVEFFDVYPPDQIRIDLGLNPRQKATKIKRIVKMNQNPVGMRTVFVPRDIGKMVKDKDIKNRSLLYYLNKDKNSRVVRMEVNIQAATIMDLEADIMGVADDSTVLVRSFRTYNFADRPIMAGRVLYLSQYVGLKMEITEKSTTDGFSLDEIPATELV